MTSSILWGIVAVSAIVAVGPVAPTIYQDAYPSDPLREHALEACSQTDDTFTRLLATDRATCYRRLMPTAQSVDPVAAPPRPTANFVDLWQAAGRGRQPQNDVRLREQDAAYADPSRAALR